MKKETTYNITISGGTFNDFRVNNDGTVTITMEMHDSNTPPTVTSEAGPTFVCIPTSKISIANDFMWYVPTDVQEIELKKNILRILGDNENCFPDFFIPEDFEKVKLFGQPKTSLGYGSASCDTWINSAEQEGCTLITISQYTMLLAYMLKVLTENEMWKPEHAWYAICQDSEQLNSLDWEKTFGFKNFLTAGKKYLIPDDTRSTLGCYMASGGINDRDSKYPLARIIRDSRSDCGKKDAPYLIYGFLAK